MKARKLVRKEHYPRFLKRYEIGSVNSNGDRKETIPICLASRLARIKNRVKTALTWLKYSLLQSQKMTKVFFLKTMRTLPGSNLMMVCRSCAKFGPEVGQTLGKRIVSYRYTGLKIPPTKHDAVTNDKFI